jgi:hypothetical protein
MPRAIDNARKPAPRNARRILRTRLAPIAGTPNG